MPDVFANEQADTNSRDLDNDSLVTGAEITLLVEDLIVRELLLAIASELSTLSEHRGGVVDRVLAIFRIAREQCDAVSGLGEFLQR